MSEFLFRVGPYDVESLLPELADALRRRTENLSRQRMPGLWGMTDKLSAGKTPKFGKIKGLLLLAAGILLLVPGVKSPKELLLPLLCGVLLVFSGLSNLLSAGTDKKFRRAAEMLLRGKDIPQNPPQEVVISAEGITLPRNVGGETVPFSAFETVVESENLWVLVFGGRVVVLQKRDLVFGNADELKDMFKNRVRHCLEFGRM